MRHRALSGLCLLAVLALTLGTAPAHPRMARLGADGLEGSVATALEEASPVAQGGRVTDDFVPTDWVYLPFISRP